MKNINLYGLCVLNFTMFDGSIINCIGIDHARQSIINHLMKSKSANINNGQHNHVMLIISKSN